MIYSNSRNACERSRERICRAENKLKVNRIAEFIEINCDLVAEGTREIAYPGI
jgi:hypothetical protein